MTKNNEIENCMNNSNAAITSANETGNTYVPAYRSYSDSKLTTFINSFVPEECKVRTRADYYYLNAIVWFCATLIFIPCLLVAIRYVIKAKKEEGGNQ